MNNSSVCRIDFLVLNVKSGERLSPAGVVGGGGPGPRGQRGARHQDHPVEQHPWNGEHDENFLNKYLLMVRNVRGTELN